MKISKRWFAILMVMVMLFSITGCKQETEGTKGGDDKVTEKATDKDAGEVAQEGPAEVDMSENYDVNIFLWGPRDLDPEDEIIKYLNDKFNINIKVERLLFKEYRQALELKIASGDMPDIFRYSSSTPHIYINLQQDDYLVNVNDYIDKFGYEGMATYLEKEGMQPFGEDDGFYQLPSYKGPTKSAYVFRKDWLEAVGMEEPTTLEEMGAVLRAFKEQGLGGENTAPLTFTYGFYGPVYHLTTLFTGANEWKNVNGEWQYEYTMDETKDALKLLRDWYNEGLIDKEVFTQNETQTNAKIVNGTAGMIITGMDRYPVTLTENLLANDPDAELSMLVPLPAGPAGNGRNESTGLNNPIVVIKNGRDQVFLDRVMMFVDYIHTEEGIDILQNGIEGIHYTMDGDKRVKTDAYDRDIIHGIGNLLAMFTDYSGANKNLQGVEKANYEECMKTGVVDPFSVFTNEVVREVKKPIWDMRDQYFIEFITGTKDIDADWDEYLAEMNKLGLDKYTEEVTKYAEEKGIK